MGEEVRRAHKVSQASGSCVPLRQFRWNLEAGGTSRELTLDCFPALGAQTKEIKRN